MLSAVKYITSQSPIEKLDDLKRICPDTFCVRYPAGKGLYLQPSLPDEPNQKCYVCARKEQTIEIDTKTTTMQQLLDVVIKDHYSFNEPSISLVSSVLYEEGDDADEDLWENLPKFLVDCPGGGIINGSVLSVYDFSQDIELRIIIKHVDKADFDEEKYPNFFRVVMDGGDSSSDDLNGDLNKKRTAGDGVVTAGIDQNENTHKKTKLDNPSTGTGNEDVII